MNAWLPGCDTKFLNAWGKYGVLKTYAVGACAKPCPGCQQPHKKRPADRVCADCLIKIAEHAVYAKAVADSLAEKQSVLVPKVAHEVFIPHDASPFDKEELSVADALHALALLLAQPMDQAPEDCPALFPAKRGDHRTRSLAPYAMPPEALTRLRELHAAIGQMGARAYTKGRESGGNLLARLVSGDVAPNELNRKSIDNDDGD